MTALIYSIWIMQGLLLVLPVAGLAYVMGLGGTTLVYGIATAGMVFMILELGSDFLGNCPSKFLKKYLNSEE